nr:tryptophan--tRNA ligase [Patescibacteria group bacterium]
QVLSSAPIKTPIGYNNYMSKEIILTGLRVNSDFTLGNYFGGIAPIVSMATKHAGEYQINMFIPDLHTITVEVDYANLQNAIMSGLKDFVAAGLPIDHDDVFLYRQSRIPAHSELAWIFECFTGFGEASRMVEFKDKSAQIGVDRVSAGLFNYPMLMAADILLYGARWVPVGDDQRQHIELTRTLAQRFNNKFGELFVVPEETKKQAHFIGQAEPLRIRSFRNPDKKMSKSIDDPVGTILLTDNPDDAAKKVLSATTDSVGLINYDWQTQPGLANLLQLFALLSGKTQEEVNLEWVGQTQYGPLKNAVADLVKEFLIRHQKLRNDVDESIINYKLLQSEQALVPTVNKRLYKVQKAVGLR